MYYLRRNEPEQINKTAMLIKKPNMDIIVHWLDPLLEKCRNSN